MRALLIECLEGEVRVEGKAYFKIRGLWIQLAADYTALLHDDFRTILRQTLIKPDEEGQLPHTWKGNNPEIFLTEPSVKKFLPTTIKIRAFMKKLNETKVSFVTPTGIVNQKRLIGEILKVKEIVIHKDAIEKELAVQDQKTLIPRLKTKLGDGADLIIKALKGGAFNYPAKEQECHGEEQKKKIR